MITSVKFAAALLLISAFREPDPKPLVQVEHVIKKPQRGQDLGTQNYQPSAAERPFYEKLAKNELATGGLTGDYDIHARQSKFVGWFGIVREAVEEKDKAQTVLVLEHKYFDGLTDVHIQAVSFNGGGDFRAGVRGVGHKIEPLSLVKVYGAVAKDQDEDDLPQLDAVFLRDWHWGTFTFLGAFGDQHGSEKWRKLNQVKLDDIYDPYPDDKYYELRLGKKPAKNKG